MNTIFTECYDMLKRHLDEIDENMKQTHLEDFGWLVSLIRNRQKKEWNKLCAKYEKNVGVNGYIISGIYGL